MGLKESAGGVAGVQSEAPIGWLRPGQDQCVQTGQNSDPLRSRESVGIQWRKLLGPVGKGIQVLTWDLREKAAARAGLGRILPESSMLFLCDMQEKLRDKVLYFPQIVCVAARLLKVARLLEVPAVLTEQYPQGLGPTVPELGAQGLRPVSKTCLSMVPSLQQELDSRPQLQSVLLCGIETQGCILHTALDLLDRGLQVHVAVDACSSRSELNRLVALGRMRQSGVFLSTSEVLILQLMRDSAHPQFKEIQKILKEPVPDFGLLGFFQGQNPCC